MNDCSFTTAIDNDNNIIIGGYTYSSDIPNNWFWEFGDDNFSLGKNPEHIYKKEGNYYITLNASNKYGIVSIIKKLLLLEKIMRNIQNGYQL